MRAVVLAALVAWGCGDDGGACPQLAPNCDDADPCTIDSSTPGTDRCHTPVCTHTPKPAGAADQCCPASATQRTDPDCAPRCGDQVLDPGEQCDDGNVKPFDGCSITCQIEETLILSSFEFEDGLTGCDLDGNGMVDNAIGAATNTSTRQLMTSFSTNELHRDGAYLVNLFVLTDLHDLGGRDDSGFKLGMVFGKDDMAVANNFDQTGVFPIDPRTVIAGAPMTGWMPATIAGSILEVQATTTTVPLTISSQRPAEGNFVEFAPLRLTHFVVTTQATPQGDRIAGVTSGRLCGAVRIRSLARFANSTGVGGPTYIDIMALGLDYLNYHIMPTQPDADLDGDGPEILMDTDGDKQVDLCIDGNGTQIGPLRPDCVADPRIADGYTISINITAAAARIGGVAP